MTKPCYKCERRLVGERDKSCHDECDDYQATRRKYKEGPNDIEEYFYDKNTAFKKEYYWRNYYG